MLSVEKAIQSILDHITPLNDEEVPILNGLGRIASKDVYASLNVPPWDSSAVDGFALRAEDTRGASQTNPRILQVSETLKAGAMAKHEIYPGTAIRIMTGAPLPPGADSVVKFEDSFQKIDLPGKGQQVSLEHEIDQGSNVRTAGENLPSGLKIISRGLPIGPADLNLLASQGLSRISVFRRPVVAVIATGEELATPGHSLPIPQIFNGNGYSLAAQVLRSGGLPKILGIARDNRASLLAKIKQGMNADAIVTSGGVSYGDYDLVKDMMNELGKMIFWQVRMTPGKSFAFAVLQQAGPNGHARNIPHFALTGNPTATLINFEVLVRPAISKMLGRTDLEAKMVVAVMEESLQNNTGTQRFIWTRLTQRNGCYFAVPTTALTQGVFSSMSLADSLAVIPEDVRLIEKGEKIKVILLNWS